VPDEPAGELAERVRRKLGTEPIEDLRIDLEDGHGMDVRVGELHPRQGPDPGRGHRAEEHDPRAAEHGQRDGVHDPAEHRPRTTRIPPPAATTNRDLIPVIATMATFCANALIGMPLKTGEIALAPMSATDAVHVGHAEGEEVVGLPRLLLERGEVGIGEARVVVRLRLARGATGGHRRRFRHPRPRPPRRPVPDRYRKER
jgi:hypothetical protein